MSSTICETKHNNETFAVFGLTCYMNISEFRGKVERQYSCLMRKKRHEGNASDFNSMISHRIINNTTTVEEAITNDPACHHLLWQSQYLSGHV